MTPEQADKVIQALQQIALELADMNARPKAAPAPVYNAPAPVRPAQAFPPIGWTCPSHGGQKIVPAGVSSKTGKPYDAFVTCPEYGCSERPPKFPLAQPAKAVPPRELP